MIYYHHSASRVQRNKSFSSFDLLIITELELWYMKMVAVSNRCGAVGRSSRKELVSYCAVAFILLQQLLGAAYASLGSYSPEQSITAGSWNPKTSSQEQKGDQLEEHLLNRKWKLRGQSTGGLTNCQITYCRTAGGANNVDRQRRTLSSSNAYSMEASAPPSSSSIQTTKINKRLPPLDTNELMSMDYTPVHRKPPINNRIPYFPAHQPHLPSSSHH